MIVVFTVLLATVLATASKPNITKLDCGVRVLAYNYALKNQPWLAPHQEVYNALQLSKLCNHPISKLRSTPPPPQICTTTHCFYVSPNASPHGTGTFNSPFLTPYDALIASRKLSSSSNTTIIFRQGIHTLYRTLTLTEQDNGLTLLGYPGEEIWFAGSIAIPKSTPWIKWQKNIFRANLTNVLQDFQLPNITSVFTSKPHRRLYRARYPNSDPEIDQWGYDSSQKLKYSIAADVVEEWIKPSQGEVPNFVYTNFAASNPTNLIKNDSTMPGYNLYASGSGGVCTDLWGPKADSYWCSNASSGGWAEVDQEAATSGNLQIPIGMHYNTTTKDGIVLNAWAVNQSKDGIVHAWHSQSWSLHMFEIASNQQGQLTFKKGGGKQGGRNWCRCDQCDYAGPWCGQHQTPPINDTRLISGTWMVENVFSELDNPNEFYLDRATMMLYVYPNTTHYLNSLNTFEYRISTTTTILDLTNVQNINIINIGFRDAAATYIDDWSAPSGGDWSLHRGGSLFLENVQNINILNCSFERNDGNAIFLSKRTRNVVVDKCSFAWIGESAIATWGETDHYDATSGNQPRGTMITNNIMREIGIYQKQSSGWGQAKTALSNITNNIMFNMPRAAINFNDMMGGGDVVESNLIFNTCRESGDHGPINSWSRQPFLTTVKDGKTKSFDPAPRIIRKNFIFANYGNKKVSPQLVLFYVLFSLTLFFWFLFSYLFCF